MSSPSDERLHAYLSGLSKEQLADRLLALAERDEVALTALRAEEAAASGEFDLAAFRKELTARIRISGFLDWRGAAGYAQRMHGLLDVLEALIAAGRAADVVVLAEHVTRGSILRWAGSTIRTGTWAACSTASPASTSPHVTLRGQNQSDWRRRWSSSR